MLPVHSPLYGVCHPANYWNGGEGGLGGGKEPPILLLMWQLPPNNRARWKSGADVTTGSVASWDGNFVALFLKKASAIFSER